MDYINSYVNEVGKRLPSKTRGDIQKELNSILMDMIEDRAASSGKEVNDSLVKDVLKEYGSPDQVAARYLPERYLISPKMFPLFWMVIRIAAVVLTIIITLAFGLKLGQEIDAGKNLAMLFLEYITGIMQALIQAFGTIVVVFYLIQRFSPSQDFLDKSWDPNSLEEVKESAKVDRGDLMMTMVFVLIGLTVFAFFPDRLPFGYTSDQGWVSFNVFTDTFFRYIPVFCIIWIAELFLNAYVLFRNEWGYTTRIMDIVLDVAGAILLLVMITGPSIVQLPTNLIPAGVFTETAFETVQKAFVSGMDVVMGIALIVTAVKTGKNIYTLVNEIK